MSHHISQWATTSHNEPPGLTMNHHVSRWATSSHNKPTLRTMSHHILPIFVQYVRNYTLIYITIVIILLSNIIVISLIWTVPRGLAGLGHGCVFISGSQRSWSYMVEPQQSWSRVGHTTQIDGPHNGANYHKSCRVCPISHTIISGWIGYRASRTLQIFYGM
jgi:hypothetical protein